jgi:hypothetical protein
MSPAQKGDVATFAVMTVLSVLWIWGSRNLPAPLARRTRLRATGAFMCASVLLIGNVSPFDSLSNGASLAVMAIPILVGLYFFYKASRNV